MQHTCMPRSTYYIIIIFSATHYSIEVLNFVVEVVIKIVAPLACSLILTPACVHIKADSIVAEKSV